MEPHPSSCLGRFLTPTLKPYWKIQMKVLLNWPYPESYRVDSELFKEENKTDDVQERGKSKERARKEQGKSKERARKEQGKSKERARKEQGGFPPITPTGAGWGGVAKHYAAYNPATPCPVRRTGTEQRPYPATPHEHRTTAVLIAMPA